MKTAHGTFFIIALAMTIASFIGAGCNSGDKKETSDTTTVSTSSTGSDTSTARLNDADKNYLHTIRMTRQNFIDVFQSHSANNDIKMIYFELNLNSPGNYSLRAYGADENGDRETGNFDLGIVEEVPAKEFDPAQDNYLQQLTRGNVKHFLGLPTRTNVPIPSASFKDEVWLTPCTMKDENGETLIYFRVTDPDTNTACPDAPSTERGLMNTNPSPPGLPCVGECDEIMFKKKFNKIQLKANPVIK